MMKRLSKKPVLLSLFLFNLLVALIAGLTIDGAQGIATSVGMGVVALGAGGALLLQRRRPAAA
jgi:MYXO-CTERM domain-containing protein